MTRIWTESESFIVHATRDLADPGSQVMTVERRPAGGRERCRSAPPWRREGEGSCVCRRLVGPGCRRRRRRRRDRLMLFGRRRLIVFVSSAGTRVAAAVAASATAA